MLAHVGSYHFLYSNNGTEMKSNASFGWALVGSCLLFPSSEYLKVITHDNLEEIYCISYLKGNKRGRKQDLYLPYYSCYMVHNFSPPPEKMDMFKS
jgi:hypothetical protein